MWPRTCHPVRPRGDSTCQRFRGLYILFYHTNVSCVSTKGSLIPVGEEISRFEVDDSLSWVLIVEKEVFSLLDSDLR